MNTNAPVETSNQTQCPTLDPFTVLCKLAILSFKPDGTKLGFSHNTIYFCEKSLLQGIHRLYSGNKREDINEITIPIYWACKWYMCNDTYILKIFEYARDGLDHIFKLYADDVILQKCIQFNILILNTFLKRDSNLSPSIDSLISSTINNLDVTKYEKTYKSHWSKFDVELVADLFYYLSNKKNLVLQKCLDCVDLFLKTKELNAQ